MPISNGRGTALVLSAAACAVTLSATSTALAQKLLIDGVIAVHSGLEGADPGFGVVEWQRQRLRLQLGAEWSSSESKKHALGLYGLFELERSGSFGAEFRYRTWMNKSVGAFVGPVAILRPQSLFGVQAGVTFALPLGDDFALFAEGSFAAFPLGSDLPHSGAIIMWASLGVGLKLHF